MVRSEREIRDRFMQLLSMLEAERRFERKLRRRRRACITPTIGQISRASVAEALAWVLCEKEHPV